MKFQINYYYILLHLFPIQDSSKEHELSLLHPGSQILFWQIWLARQSSSLLQIDLQIPLSQCSSFKQWVSLRQEEKQYFPKHVCPDKHSESDSHGRKDCLQLERGLPINGCGQLHCFVWFSTIHCAFVPQAFEREHKSEKN